MSHDDIALPGTVSPRFVDHASEPRNQGELVAPSGRAEMVGSCGDAIVLHLTVEAERLTAVKVQPKGCVYTLVCASAVSVLAQGLTLDQALGLEPEDVAAELGGLPEDHMHCARLAVNVLGEAIADHLGKAHGNGNNKGRGNGDGQR